MESKKLKSSKTILKSKDKNIKKNNSSYNNLFLGVNKKISKSLTKDKEKKLPTPSNNNKTNKDNNENEEETIPNKYQNAIILKNKWKKLQREINIYAKKSLDELKVTEKIKQTTKKIMN